MSIQEAANLAGHDAPRSSLELSERLRFLAIGLRAMRRETASVSVKRALTFMVEEIDLLTRGIPAIVADVTRDAERSAEIRELAAKAELRHRGVGHRVPATDRPNSAAWRLKNPAPGKRYCSNRLDPKTHEIDEVISTARFSLKDATSGNLRARCDDCFKAYQRERYARVGQKVVTVDVIEDDACIGHPCPVCSKPFLVGDRVQGDNLHHEACADIA